MVMSAPSKGSLDLPKHPVDHVDFIAYLGQHPDTPVPKLVDPFKTFEGKLREMFAQQPEHEALQKPHINTVPIFKGHQDLLKVRARSLEDQSENEKYNMPLEHKGRKPQGAPAIVGLLNEFKELRSIPGVVLSRPGLEQCGGGWLQCCHSLAARPREVQWFKEGPKVSRRDFTASKIVLGSVVSQ